MTDIDQIIYARTGISKAQFPEQFKEIRSACEAWADEENSALLAERDALLNLARAVDYATTNYERMGEVCPFEGYPMIYAETLTELGELARAALAQGEQP